jgi:hypothetical protein
VTYLIVGSEAARYNFGAEWPREPKDFDVFTDHPDAFKDADVYWAPEFHEIFTGARHATPDELYTIKVSHQYWALKNGSWWKHAGDIVWLKAHGAQLIPSMHDVLYRVWERDFGKKIIDLNMDKADFFDDAVPRKWDHDSVHYSVAYGDYPLYEDFFKPGAEIAIDMKKVWSAPFDTQVRLFREEIYATALERTLIPKDYRFSPRRAYAMALQKTITNLTKGRSATFLVDNLDTFMQPDVDYVKRHKDRAHMLVPHRRKGE